MEGKNERSVEWVWCIYGSDERGREGVTFNDGRWMVRFVRLYFGRCIGCGPGLEGKIWSSDLDFDSASSCLSRFYCSRAGTCRHSFSIKHCFNFFFFGRGVALSLTITM